MVPRGFRRTIITATAIIAVAGIPPNHCYRDRDRCPCDFAKTITRAPGLPRSCVPKTPYGQSCVPDERASRKPLRTKLRPGQSCVPDEAASRKPLTDKAASRVKPRPGQSRVPQTPCGQSRAPKLSDIRFGTCEDTFWLPETLVFTCMNSHQFSYT